MNSSLRPTRHERGVALLLVLVAMATATTLTIGWLASQDNASLIGRNVVATSEARSVASSGLDLAISVMQTETDWRTKHQDGVLFRDLAVGDGTIHLSLLDPTTNLPPTSESVEIHVISTATVGAISQSVAAYVSLLGGDEDEDLQQNVSGFALFSLSTIEINDNATVARWSAAPASALGHRLAMGTASSASRSVRIGDNAATIDTTLYHGQGPSPALMINSTEFDVNTMELPWPLALDGVQAPLDSSTASMPSPGNMGALDEVPAGSLRLGSHDVLHVSPAFPLLVEGNLLLDPGARLVIEGDARLQVGGTLVMDDASIELLPHATLHAVIAAGAVISDSRIGSMDGWIDPNRITLSHGADDTLAHTWHISGDSSLTGCIDGRAIDVVLQDHAVVQGRIAANRITLNDSSCLLYDHGLSEGIGQPRAGRLLHEVRDSRRSRSRFLDRLPGAFLDSMRALGDDRDWNQRSWPKGVRTRGNAGPYRGWRHDPTPRPVPVECRLLTHGIDACSWEAMVLQQEGRQ